MYSILDGILITQMTLTREGQWIGWACLTVGPYNNFHVHDSQICKADHPCLCGPRGASSPFKEKVEDLKI